MTKKLADAVYAAELTTKKEGKKAALDGLGTDDLRLVMEALNPYRVFNIRKYDWPTAFASIDPVGYQNFFTLLDQLQARAITGNAARNAVTAVLGTYTERTAVILARVLNKDLKCGAHTTFEKLYPGFAIPYYDLMLCDKIKDNKKWSWTFPCWAEVKYDGMRGTARVENGVVTLLSREGNTMDYYDGLFDVDLVEMERLWGAPIMVDGETLSVGFQDTMISKGSGADKSNMRFNAFDVMSLSEWDARSCPRDQMARRKQLEALILAAKTTKVLLSIGKVLHNMAEAEEFYFQVTEHGLPGQDEGLIIKQMAGLYEWNAKKRTLTWAKWKPVIDVDVKIVGCYEGNKDSKNEGKLGGIYVKGVDESGNVIDSKCGGFKVNSKKFNAWLKAFAKSKGVDLNAKGAVSRDEFFRTYFWQHQDELIGETCTIETQGLSQARGSSTFSLRFPQFLMLRDPADKRLK